MLIFLKLFALTSIVFFIILFGWDNLYNSTCYILILPFVILLLVSHSFIELKMRERICFKNCYFKESSIFAKILSSRVLVTIFYVFVSILMSISALFGVIFYPLELWFYLIFHVGLVIFFYRYFHYLFRDTVKENYLSLFAREWAVNISSVFLIAVFIYLTLYSYEPTYLQQTLSQTIIVASNSVASSCEITSYILKLKIELDSIFWWIASNSTDALDNKLTKLAIWVIFLLINTLAILGINRLIAQIAYLIDTKFKKELH